MNAGVTKDVLDLHQRHTSVVELRGDAMKYRLVNWIDGIAVRADKVAQLADADASARALLSQAFWRIRGTESLC